VYGLLFISYTLLAQTHTHTTRILFQLDGSGSMKELWDGQSKFNRARDLVSHLVDSIEKKNPNIEFGLRVFGHQYYYTLNNCKDSKLEVPFSKNNADAIKTALGKITPQGNTPIAYSLFESLSDFPVDSNASNAEILVTDGVETCQGNPCALSQLFAKRKVSFRPFIIGLGIADSLKHEYDCIGNFFDVKDEKVFNHVMNVVVSQALNNTTAQVNLLDAYGNPTVTNLEMTFYDHFSHSAKYNFIHTFNDKGNPDTLHLDPLTTYDLVIHSFPPIQKDTIQLSPGSHNVIAVDVPQGTLSLQIPNNKDAFTNIQCVVRESGSPRILNVQDFNTDQDYISGNYDLEILTLPKLELYNEEIAPGKPTVIKVDAAGILNLSTSQQGVASIYVDHDGKLEKIYDFGSIKTTATVNLQPGNYMLIWRPDKGKQSVLTEKINIKIVSNETVNQKLD